MLVLLEGLSEPVSRCHMLVGQMKQAAVVLIIKDGHILGVSRKDDAGKFGLPGGKCEPGELLADTAIRECFEETGITLRACQPIYKRVEPKTTPDGEDFEAHCYYASIWEGEPASKERTVVAWLTEKELTETKAAFPEYNTNTLAAFKTKRPYVLPGLVILPGACHRCLEVHPSDKSCSDNYPQSRIPKEVK